MSGARKRKAGIYCRISRDAEGQALGVGRQQADCEALAERLGWTVAETFVDNDIGASSRSAKRRPAYERMLAAVDAGVIDAVLAYSTSRLTRRPREFEDLIVRAEHGVRISTVAAGEVDLGTANGRAVARTLAAFDAREAEESGERSRRAKEQLRANGGYTGGPRAFGWRPGYVEPDPVEAPMVAAAADEVLAGRSLAGIAKRWQEATGGAPAKGRRGDGHGGELVRAPWRATSVRAVLANPRHAGLTNHGLPAPNPGIIDEARWRGLQAVLADPARRAAEKSTPRYLLTGIARCACGATVQAGSSASTRQRLYRCSRSYHLARAAQPVDDLVTDRLLLYLSRERLSREQPGDAGTLAGQAAGLRAQLDQLAALLAEKVLTVAGVRMESARLRRELEQVEGRLAAAAKSSALAGLPLDLDGLLDWWHAPDTDIEKRRAVLRASGLRVVLHPPGRGFKPFDPSTVSITPEEEA